LPKAIERVNQLDPQPDFVVFSGDLTHTTADPKLRRKRLAEFQNIAGRLKTKNVRFMPGEHDASLDSGEAYREFFGDLNYTFDHKGIHFIALDNVSDPRARLGNNQLAWLAEDLEQRDKDAPIVVLTHRPLFGLAPQWGWSTQDGAMAIELLMPHKNVTVFYGHIHQEHHHMTGHIPHHSAKSLIFPLPAPGSVEKKHKIAWDPNRPYHGLGVRNIETTMPGAEFDLYEINIKKG
jgi:3',5'-cyclic AMP phosphodiesterase CpdA